MLVPGPGPCRLRQPGGRGGDPAAPRAGRPAAGQALADAARRRSLGRGGRHPWAEIPRGDGHHQGPGPRGAGGGGQGACRA
eukprot:10337244-Alexandrium_andersonii.AAC.1